MDWSHYFVYDENSGNLIWKVKPSAKVKIGSIAGRLDRNGYISVKLHKHTHPAHRIYWEKAINKWRVRIMGNNGKSLSFGCFDNKDDAIAARNKAYADLGYCENHGVSNENNQ